MWPLTPWLSDGFISHHPYHPRERLEWGHRMWIIVCLSDTPPINTMQASIMGSKWPWLMDYLRNPQFRFHVTKCINFCIYTYDRWCRLYDVSFLTHEKCIVVNIVSASVQQATLKLVNRLSPNMVFLMLKWEHHSKLDILSRSQGCHDYRSPSAIRWAHWVGPCM